jgi:spore maturation protein CgeB
MNNFLIVETKKGNFSLKVKCEDGSTKTIHSLYDPEAEASSIVDAFDFNGKGILVILGLGLGYHVAEFSKKYSAAEIIVVEALNEIRDIAKEHGPAFGENVKFIVGLSPAEAIRKITDCQMRNGIKPLSVLALPAVVSAFPAYYKPLIDSLKRTMSVRLWDKLRYPKFNKDVLSIVLIDSGYFLVKEVEKALNSLGHKVVKVPVGKGADGENMITRHIEAISDTKPDFILTINHLGFDEEGMLTSFFRSIEMPVASWYVDSPNLILRAFDRNISQYVSLFIWDRTYIKDMKAMGFEAVEYLPLAADVNVFRPIKKGRGDPPGRPYSEESGVRSQGSKIGMTDYKCEVGFVGNSMIEPVDEWMMKVDKEHHPLVEKLAERLVNRNTPLDPLLLEGKLPDRLSEREKMDFEAAVLWKATLLYRLSCIKKLDSFDLHIHGDGGWKSVMNNKGVKLYPPLNYYREVPLFYNACKINFNATSRQMMEAVNQRVFDVPACGAFILTDYQKGLDELFDVGNEIIVYRDKDEIPGLVKYYLDNPEKREAAAKKGMERVLKEHTYKHRLDVIIKTMKVRYA